MSRNLKRRSTLITALRRPAGALCLAYILVLTVIAILAPILLPDVATQQAGDLRSTNAPPGSSHLLGTDTLGRDVLDRLLVGTRVTLVGLVIAVSCALAIGVPLGLLAGYARGFVDRVVGWIADLAFAMPTIIIIFVVLTIFPHNMVAAMVTLGLLLSPTLIRVVRSATLVVREELYIDAAKAAGLSAPYILSRHVLPRILGPIVVQASLVCGVALIVQTALAFLELVVPNPQPSWGGMIADGIRVLQTNAWLVIPPGLTVTVTILVFGLLGDVIRDTSSAAWSPPPQLMPEQRGDLGSPARSTEETDDSALLSVRSLAVTLPRDGVPVQVLHDVSFSLDEGEVVALVGESGCGKTLTARSIVGLLPSGGELTRGAVVYRGRDLATLPRKQRHALRGKAIAWVSQEPMVSLTPVFRVGWQIAEGVRRHQGISRAEAWRRAIDLLGEVGLPDPADVARRYPHELSGGMAQRVSIARALAGDPDVLIADEPTTALDVTLQAEILALLRRLQEQRKMALLLVTHDWGVVADIADRVIVMYAGEVVERADVDDIFESPCHPYTRGLIASDPHHDPDAERLPFIGGVVPRPEDWPTGCHFSDRCDFSIAACTDRTVPLLRLTDHREARCIRTDIVEEASA
ncbi:dipeptide/oligopeptide/nickel ABC transporter permease/ATP-binding protein [Nocardioides sp. BYT-33-1]|uniref:dipeptide/oligopeptide/nickel ABC transporter permease/ATP-binding protein n=1 Tax=Nocardioides sp. BYT-33-1 TaxID=3416952 RepID=UPI003F52F80D